MYYAEAWSNEQQYVSATRACTNDQQYGPPSQWNTGTQWSAQQHQSDYNRSHAYEPAVYKGGVANSQWGYTNSAQGRLSPGHYASLQTLAPTDLDLDGAPIVQQNSYPRSNNHGILEERSTRDRSVGREETRHLDRGSSYSTSQSRTDPYNQAADASRSRRDREYESRERPIRDERMADDRYRKSVSDREWRSTDRRPSSRSPTRAAHRHYEDRSHESRAYDDRYAEKRQHRDSEFSREGQSSSTSTRYDRSQAPAGQRHHEYQSDRYAAHHEKPVSERYERHSNSDREWRSTNLHSSPQSRMDSRPSLKEYPAAPERSKDYSNGDSSLDGRTAKNRPGVPARPTVWDRLQKKQPSNLDSTPAKPKNPATPKTQTQIKSPAVDDTEIKKDATVDDGESEIVFLDPFQLNALWLSKANQKEKVEKRLAKQERQRIISQKIKRRQEVFKMLRQRGKERHQLAKLATPAGTQGNTPADPSAGGGMPVPPSSDGRVGSQENDGISNSYNQVEMHGYQTHLDEEQLQKFADASYVSKHLMTIVTGVRSRTRWNRKRKLRIKSMMESRFKKRQKKALAAEQDASRPQMSGNFD